MQAFAKTDVGRVRTGNQDYYFCTTKPIGKLNNLFLVADGMECHIRNKQNAFGNSI